jgi:Uma2 family endonuclease
MPVQTQHRFSIGDYHRMAETGVLRPGKRVELINGNIIDMSPIGPFHGGVVKRLSRLSNLEAKGRWTVSTQDPLRLDEFSEPEPDVMLLKPASDDYTSRHPQADDVFLVVEVADSTIDYDRDQKLPAYGRARIAEVWIVNLNEFIVEVYREPNFTGYSSKAILRIGDKAYPQAFPDLITNLAQLLEH